MIAFVARYFSGMNGADRLAGGVLDALARTGHPVTCVSLDPPSAAPMDGRTGGLEWTATPREVAFPTRLAADLPRRIGRWAKWGILDRAAYRRLRSLRPELTIVNAYGSHRWWCRMLCDSAVSCLVVQESPRHFGGPHQKYSLAAAIEVLAGYSCLGFASARCRDEWCTYPSLRGKHTFYLPNCGEDAELTLLAQRDRGEVRAELGMSNDDFNVVCLATIQHRKGQDLLVDHFAELLREIPNLRLTCVGSVVGSRDWAASLVQRAEAPAFGGRVRFVGGRWDAKSFVYAADALVLPSRAEAMPLAVLEAMALGVPVVASAVDGTPELLTDGETGRLFQISRPDEMIHALASLARDPEERVRLSGAAKERYWGRFNQRQFVERYRQMAEELLAKRDAPVLSRVG